MNGRTCIIRAVILTLLAAGCLLIPGTGQSQESTGGGEQDVEKLIIAGYPDGGEWLITRVLRRVGYSYERSHPNVRVLLKPGISYLEARKMVLDGRAAGIMISEKMNLYRAHASQTGGDRGFSTLKLDKFLPFAVRRIRSREATLEKWRLGIATHRRTELLNQFLQFFDEKPARQAVRDIPDLELVTPADQPKKIEKGYKKGGTVDLEHPVFSY